MTTTQTTSRLTRVWREWLSPLAFALLFTQFGATAVRVDGVSMLPGLHHGEELLVPKLEGWAHTLGVGTYHRGDIVVFKPPRTATQEWTHAYRGLSLPWAYRPYLVKRIVGLPGDTVQVTRGTVTVNGRPLNEPRTTAYWDAACHDTASDLANTLPVTVPAGTYFVMGDNRSPGGSLDSRVFGPVSTADIAGRAVASVWPLAAPTNVTPACDGLEHPEKRVGTSGTEQWTPRLLLP
ncbi:signal peptidase I [Deinococcus metalli]|uniref:Signal peptidase I n=1 Tax=Deinococcus metalli TaxID=1141878 RepID=A0A7W8KKU4_9DEIO|nr:signal peptidase I [Deinococcus metalli]MBB5378841.1 signal peptidase I [Deinococcus metalli]GHF62085.1 signal peptidase I [Deinococcus metalli]